MINYNLRENWYKSHPMDEKYGIITGNVKYDGYPVTIVDNSKEVEDDIFTEKPSLCLIHLSERVREYASLRAGNEFLYLNFSLRVPTYRMYDYKYENLSKEQIIQDLKTVFYYLEPNLQSRSMVGRYVLNNEEEYTIIKYLNEYKFYKGNNPDWNNEKDLIYSDTIDFDLYEKALYVSNLRNTIVTKTNELLDSEDILEKIKTYKENKSELELKLNINNL